MKPILEIHNISKKFRIRHENQPYLNIREALTLMFKSKSTTEEFYALKDVTFNINQGESIGIIGKNGAGKSTLLKILSKITLPSEGKVISRGRIASLLEVGTGFHSELSGKENIFLNGSILGMKRKEIQSKFDEIVDFSGVEKFLDTPLKHFSSGMQLRLAFAVAAFLEPEILIIDEVLAVGDAEFQKKCLGKMDDISKKEGRTILIVSHSMTTIKQLCSKIVLLNHGKTEAFGENVSEIIHKYLNKEDEITLPTYCKINQAEFQNNYFVPSKFYIGNENGEPVVNPNKRNNDLYVHIEGIVKNANPYLTIGYAIYSFDENNTLLYWTYQTDAIPEINVIIKNGMLRIKSSIPSYFLNAGTYRIELLGGIHYRSWLFEPGTDTPTVFITIEEPMSQSHFWLSKRPGIIAPVNKWIEY